MAAVVPSQVVNFIDAVFPWAKNKKILRTTVNPWGETIRQPLVR